MDTSKTYIKMCDCEEIQSQIPPIGKWDGAHEYTVGRCSDGNLKWLPRQDQIQEMVDYPLMCALEFLERVIDCITSNNGNLSKYYWQFDTMEKLWLVFYMHEKHSLKWKGGKWQ